MEKDKLQRIGAKDKLHIKKLIKELEQIRGRHTELISIYIPAGYEITQKLTQVQQEQGTATNIKSKTIQIVNQILAESFDKVKTLVLNKVHKMSNESITEVKESVAAFAKSPGTTKISTKPSSLYEMSKENTEGLGEKVARLKALTKGLNVKF